MRFSKRQLIAYGLSALIFAGAVWAALRLSFPPDPVAYRMDLETRRPPEIELKPDRDVLTIRRNKEERKYRIRQTNQGLVAEPIQDEK